MKSRNGKPAPVIYTSTHDEAIINSIHRDAELLASKPWPAGNAGGSSRAPGGTMETLAQALSSKSVFHYGFNALDARVSAR